MEVGAPNLGCDNIVALAKQTLISSKAFEASSFKINSLAFNNVMYNVCTVRYKPVVKVD